MSSGKRYPVGILDDTCMLIMIRTCLGPKSSSMWFGYSYFTGHDYDLLSICVTSQVFKYKISSCIHGILHFMVNSKVLNLISSKNVVSITILPQI
jgi:hypothetical protein